MQNPGVEPELKGLVAEAALALARLDADRLEAMAHSCQALNCELACDLSVERRSQLQVQARAAAKEMAALAHVMQATRSNLAVMNRLRELHSRRTDYSARLVSE